MLSATRTLMKNGRRAMIGTCACCGTKMYIAGVWDGDQLSASAAFASGTAAPSPLPPLAESSPSG